MFDNETLLFKYNVDTNGNPISINVEKEQKQVSINGTIQMEFIPDEFNRVVMLDEKNQQMYEVFNRDEIASDTYYVDYASGVIYFDKAQFGKVKMYNYYNRGFQMIGASRIYDEESVTGNFIARTIQEIINEGRKCLELIKSLGDAVVIINKLNQNIIDGNALHDKLVSDIAIATPLQTNLRKDINEANTFRTQLNEDVATGTVLNTNLRQNVIDGNKTNGDLTKNLTDAKGSIDLIRGSGNENKIITSASWTLNSDGEYEHTWTHNLNSTNIIIAMFDNDTKESLNYTYQVIDGNKIKILSDVQKSVKVVLNTQYYSGGMDTKEEMVEARKGKATLKAKIDDIDANISNKIDKTGIVNNLTTGGTTSVLSAEQGKVLDSKIENKISEVNTQLAEKIDKVSGKGLSTNDYDNTEKTEVAKIRNKADISYVDTKIAGLSSVTPVFVNSIAEMGNANKAYINLSDTDTNGYYIYYHNGTQFIKSSVLYQSKGASDGTITRDMLNVNVSGLNNNKTIVYYETGRAKVIVEETEKNVYTRTEIFYNLDGTISSVKENYNNKSITSTFNYNVDGSLNFVQNSLV